MMLFTLQKECEQQKCELQYLSLSLLLPLPHPISLPLSLPLPQNEWEQTYVSTKTAQNHQYLRQFLTDLHETFTIGG